MRIKPQSNPWKTRILLLVTLLALLSAAGLYYYTHPEELPEWASRTPVGRDLQTATVYKWQDAQGGWHITDEPPAPGTPYETQRWSRDTNVLPAPRARIIHRD
ncbi:MAG: DUF4124 domain-containing protein [Chromatiales bacterium]|jgi:hypothetical protein